MEQNFEQDIPIAAVIAAFVVLTLFSFFIKRKLRDRELLRQGQLSNQGTRIPTIEERLAANQAWARGEIRSQGIGPVIILWISAIAWNLTFGVSFIKSFSNPAATIAQKIVLGMFALIGGIPFIYFAIRFTIRHYRYGNSYCMIRGKAGVLGKTIEGKIKTSTELQATGDYAVMLQCIDWYTTGSGKKKKTHSEVRWQGKQIVPSAGVSSIAGIPFSISLPPYPPETGYQLARGKITWQLRIEAPVKGVDYSSTFIVPVFKMD